MGVYLFIEAEDAVLEAIAQAPAGSAAAIRTIADERYEAMKKIDLRSDEDMALYDAENAKIAALGENALHLAFLMNDQGLHRFQGRQLAETFGHDADCGGTKNRQEMLMLLERQRAWADRRNIIFLGGRPSDDALSASAALHNATIDRAIEALQKGQLRALHWS